MMLWIFLLVLVLAVLEGYFILNMPLLALVLIVVLGGCLLAFIAFGRIEKDTEKEVDKLTRKK